ncbi:1-acyl-sn-glycerol-3-phosphate acyltransferase [Andreesenia angusta]|uniref:1-acyl-sn-glycerol-3-phosphate acyltransferase n=1 Tax=Andreesenia angusta TaxID=39480 RepID=A0A1S1V982_9FIRM|nr:lysophospholipid acyltransferase family protein [Andreesenia angusta]OHW62960.1 1-acyl-sn-glycerol-3-phosphate acyltransferase [Andreesenia angusta]
MGFYNIARLATKAYMNIMFKVTVIGKENVPLEGNYIICSNHKTQLDPVALGLVTKRQLFFMAKKELFEKNIFLGKLLQLLGAFPVARESADVSAIKNAIRFLKKGELFAMFPEGTRTEKMDLSKAKAGISMISIKSKSPIIPVHIESEYEFRKPLKITVGKPFSFEQYYGKKLETEDYVELSREILVKIYSL